MHLYELHRRQQPAIQGIHLASAIIGPWTLDVPSPMPYVNDAEMTADLFKKLEDDPKYLPYLIEHYLLKIT